MTLEILIPLFNVRLTATGYGGIEMPTFYGLMCVSPEAIDGFYAIKD